MEIMIWMIARHECERRGKRETWQRHVLSQLQVGDEW